MIQLYAKGTTDFSKNGIMLHPQESTVTFQDNGQFDLEIVVPAGKDYTDFDYGQILRATVPEQVTGDISLGVVTYWSVTNAEGSTLYEVIPTLKTVKYKNWSFSHATSTQGTYSVGNKVSYNGRNYRCIAYDQGSAMCQVPPSGNPSWWTEIPRTTGVAGKVAEELEQGDVVTKTGDFNDEYMEAASMSGKTGYIKKADCTARGDSEERIIPSRTITEQNFMITDIRKEQQGQTIRIVAEHVSYQLGRTPVGDCSVNTVTPATAILFLTGAFQEAYGGNIYTDMSEPMLTADWSWSNGQSAIFDPKAGLIVLTNARIIRDDLDVFLLAQPETESPKYSVRFGANMKSVKWIGNVDNMVTRIYPIAQTEDGSTLLLPEKYIDTVRTVPFIRPEVLKTGLKIGQKEKQSGGEEIELTEQDVYTRMRQQANNRFTVDECDKAEVNLELDWQHMPDTEEYSQYRALRNAAPGELVEVVNGPLGISELIRMTGYTWDPMLCVYKGAKFGTIKTKPTVAGYSLKSGSVTGTALAYNAVGGQHLQAASITAREIEANSITADHIASKSIVTELIAANAITADEISANSITTEKLAANSITAEKIQAGAITAREIAAYAITANLIAANAITSDKIMANAITAEKIAAHCITADQIQAYAITSTVIAASAITADKIAASAITADKIAANAVTADTIAAGAVTTIAIAADAVQAGNIAAGAIVTDKLDAGAVTAVKIASGAIITDKLDAGAVTAVKIAAGAVETEKLAANAVTAGKIAANAVTADKIEAGAINANKISATDISAINAKLGTATIASGYINNADINYARIKDATLGTAIIETSITDKGVADRLYINRLMITYGQMVEATIGDLVIGASDGNYYHVDVDWDEYGVPTLVPELVDAPSAAEIAAGHTSDGHTIIGNVGTFAELSSEDFYAINSIIDRITAKRIDVDELWARQAFINKLMVQDISSNTYIQSTIGNWTGGSTITQTIDGLNSRISSLGYGTVYMQPNEPNHADLSSGDIWIQTLPDATWQDVYDNYSSWQEIYDTVSTWQVLGGIPKMLVWDGRHWQEMYDALLPVTMETQIEQLADAINLRATRTEVDLLSGEVSEFRSELTIQADQIESAVSAVNTKASTYVMWADPRTVYTVTLGDIWLKQDENLQSWQDVYDNYSSWNDIYNTYDEWEDLLGSATYVWNGEEWVLTADRASEISSSTRITQTEKSITLMADQQATFQGELISLSSRLSVTASQISAEVQRATGAEGTLQSKTQFLMTSGLITLDAFSSGNDGSAMGVVKKAGISIDANGKINISAMNQSAQNAINKAAAITVDGSGKITISAIEESGRNAINKAAGIEVDGSGKITINAMANDAKNAINKAAGIEMSDGKITINALVTDAKNAINKAAGIEVDGNGKITLNAMTETVKGTINKAANISVDASGLITLSALSQSVQGTINKAANISVDASGKIVLSSLSTDVQGTLSKAAGIEMEDGKIKITAMVTDAQNAINKAAGITVDGNGKITLSALAEDVQGNINKAANITVNSSGKILISAMESSAQTAINKATNIAVNGSGKIVTDALETSAKNAVNKAAAIAVNSDNKILNTSLETSVQTAINKAANITVDSSGKIKLSSLETTTQQAVTKAEAIAVDSNGKILKTALESSVQTTIDKAAGITVDSNGKIKLSSMETTTQQAVTKAEGIQVDSNGKIKKIALEDSVQTTITKAANITVDSNGKIVLSALSSTVQTSLGKADTSYQEQSGITITSAGIAVSGSKYIKLDVNSYNYVHISSTGIEMNGSRVSVNGKDMWARDDIIVLHRGDSEADVIASQSGKHDWVLIKPYYDATLEFDKNEQAVESEAARTFQLGRVTEGAFGTATSYRYVLTFDIVSSVAKDSTITIYVANATEPEGASKKITFTTQRIYLQPNVTQTISVTVDSATNLCADEFVTMWAKFTGMTRTFTLRNVSLVASAPATTSKVPCTVYYFT